MDVIAQIFNLSNIILCLAIVGLVWFQRKGIEVLVKKFGKKDLKESKIWTEFAVPLGPLGTGMLVMLIPSLPIPEMFVGSWGAKMIFGVGLGLVSGLIFRLVKKNILEKLGKSDEKTPYLEE